MIKTTPFDPAEYVDTPEAARAYLDDAFASGDAIEITDALGVVARARGMSELARRTGLSRQALYVALSSKGDPTLSSLLNVLKALGVTLEIGQVDAETEKRSRRSEARNPVKGSFVAKAAPAGDKSSKSKRKTRAKLTTAAII